MLRVTKFVHFILGYITFECHQNELLYFVLHCTTGRCSNLHMWFEVVIIEVDGDILCLLLVEIVCATKQPRHLENINDNQAEAGTAYCRLKM